MPRPLLGEWGEETEIFLFGEGVASFLGEEEAGSPPPRGMDNRQGLVRPRYLNAYCTPDSLTLLLLPPVHRGPLRERAPGQLIWSLEGRPSCPAPLPTPRTLSIFAIFSTDMSIDLLDSVLGA